MKAAAAIFFGAKLGGPATRVIRFIIEHKDHRVSLVVGDADGRGLRWGVEPMSNVLSGHGIKISPG